MTGSDPEFAAESDDDGPRLRVRNVVNRLTFAASERGPASTTWQRSLYPVVVQARITKLHKGVDTQQARPDPRARLNLGR